MASDLLSRSVSAASDLLRSLGADVYGLLPLSAQANSNILHAVTSSTSDVTLRRHRQQVKTLVASLSRSMERLLQVLVLTVRTLDLRSRDREFNSRSGCYHVVTTWMGGCLRTGKPSRHITSAKRLTRPFIPLG